MTQLSSLCTCSLAQSSVGQNWALCDQVLCSGSWKAKIKISASCSPFQQLGERIHF